MSKSKSKLASHAIQMFWRESRVIYNPNKYWHCTQSFWCDKYSKSLLRFIAFSSSWFLNHTEVFRWEEPVTLVRIVT